MTETTVFEDAHAMSVGAAELVVRACRAAIAARGKFSIALSGGDTPVELHRLLASEGYRERIDWGRWWVFFGDDRFVPPTDAASNEGMARATLLDHVPIPPEQVFPMWKPVSPEAAAAAYAATLVAQLGPTGAVDVAVMGIGDDGHTASLFPGIPGLAERRRLVIPTESPVGVRQRLTLTMPPLQAAGATLFLVAGAEKRAAFARATGPNDADRPPSGVLAAGAVRAVWYVDRAASGA